MNTSVLTRDMLRPRSSGGGGTGFALSLLVHSLLIVALAFAVKWRSSEPTGVSAELWSAVPQVAAPKIETPPPQPEVKPAPPVPPPKVDTQQRDAQIAIEKRREREKQLQREADEKAQRDKLLRDKAEREKAEKEKADAQRQQKAEEARREKNRQDQLKRMQGLMDATGAPTSTGTAARDAGPSSSYAGRVVARIYPNIVLVDTVPGNPVTEVVVYMSPDGTIIGKDVKKRSGVPEWDEAVLRAIDRTQVLPRDVDGRAPSSLLLVFNPRK
ncbi:MAG: cell envelope integrity protein TolA [Betaproteobacteria bacterium]|nr:MAG: cell envelope integrity protein TolA [Betaproteobacteria bacterium]